MLVAGGWRGWLPGVGCDMLVAGVGGMGDYRAELLRHVGGWWRKGGHIRRMEYFPKFVV
jgi:hypothetical protein